MTFNSFYEELTELIKLQEKNGVPLKIESDLESNIVKIFGERITSLAKAKNGLNDVIELAYATAEHHPYWNLLYNCAEIAETVLSKWTENLSKKDMEYIDWLIKELRHTMEKL